MISVILCLFAVAGVWAYVVGLFGANTDFDEAARTLRKDSSLILKEEEEQLRKY